MAKRPRKTAFMPRLSKAEQQLREDLFYASVAKAKPSKTTQPIQTKETEMSNAKPLNMPSIPVPELPQETIVEVTKVEETIVISTIATDTATATEEVVEVLDIVMSHASEEVVAARGETAHTVPLDDSPIQDVPEAAPSAKESLGKTLDRLTSEAVKNFPLVVVKRPVNAIPRELVYGKTTMTIRFVPSLKADETVDHERIEAFVRNELHRMNMRMDNPRDVLILPSDMQFNAAFLEAQHATYVPSKDGCPAHLKFDLSFYAEEEILEDEAC